MNRPAVLDRLLRLELRARRIVEGLLMGKQASPYHGSAVEFASHRQYSPGDELRHLDWKVWWKTQRLYVKQHDEETHLPCHLVVDASRSMRYGDEGGWSKYDHAATAAASLAQLLVRQQDAAGLVVFRDSVTKQLPPSSHRQQADAIARELDAVRPESGTDLGSSLADLASRFRRRGMVVLISDLMVEATELAAALRDLHARRHEVLVLHVLHGDELAFPFDGVTLFRGLEDSDELQADPAALRLSYLREFEAFLDRTRRECLRASADYQLVDMRLPLEAVLAELLSRRARSRS